jgi:hypothetical protein
MRAFSPNSSSAKIATYLVRCSGPRSSMSRTRGSSNSSSSAFDAGKLATKERMWSFRGLMYFGSHLRSSMKLPHSLKRLY